MENFAKLKTRDIKSQAERKDIYLDNNFIAISKYIKITDEDINRLKIWKAKTPLITPFKILKNF